MKMFDATPGERYLVRAQTSMTRDGDLLYLGTWQQPQVRSLSGASSSGIPAPLIAQRWFPGERAFVATAPPGVRVLIHSEAPSTGFLISSLDIRRLRPATASRPMTGRLPDVLCVSSIDWDFIWQGHQEIMSRMAAKGHRVLFVENTGVRAPKVRDLPRVRQRIRNWWRGTKGFPRERPNLFVYSPLLLPLPYSRLARWINRSLLSRALRRWMEAVGFAGRFSGRSCRRRSRST